MVDEGKQAQAIMLSYIRYALNFINCIPEFQFVLSQK